MMFRSPADTLAIAREITVECLCSVLFFRLRHFDHVLLYRHVHYLFKAFITIK